MLNVLPEIRITEFTIEAAEKIVNQLREISLNYAPNQPILVNISSPGGDVFALSMIYTALKSMSNEFITFTDSEASSAGAFLLCLGNVRVACPDSLIMIHEAKSGGYGTGDSMIQSGELTNHHTNIWFKKIEERSNIKSIRDILKHTPNGDLYITPTEAKELGLIDYVGYVTGIPFQGVDYQISAILGKETEEVKEEKKPNKKGSKKRGK